MIVEARNAASVKKTATLVGFERNNVSTVMLAYIKHWKTSSATNNSGPKLKLTDRIIVQIILEKLFYGSVSVWRTSTEACNVDFLFPTIKHGVGSVMSLGSISHCGLILLVLMHGRVTCTYFSRYSGLLYSCNDA